MEASKRGMLVRQHHHMTVLISKAEGSQYFIQRQMVAGHAPQVSIVCPSPFVSKVHCQIFRKNQAYWLKDNRSTNGTFLNGNKIAPECERELRFNDMIGIGVSHAEVDPKINVTEDTYYVFAFLQYDDAIARAQLLPPSDESDIEVLFESPASSCLSKSEKSNVSNATAKTRVPPPPPLLSKLDEHKKSVERVHSNNDGNVESSSSISDDEKTGKNVEQLTTGDKIQSKKAKKLTAKDYLHGEILKQAHNKIKSGKKKADFIVNANLDDKRSISIKSGTREKSNRVLSNRSPSGSVSTDDSSDGLDDVKGAVEKQLDVPRRPPKTFQGKVGAYSGVSSSTSNSPASAASSNDETSSNEDIFRKLESRQKPSWKQLCAKGEIGRDKSGTNDASKSESPMSESDDSDSDDDFKDEFSSKNVQLKKLAKKSVCQIKLKHIVYQDHEKDIKFGKQAKKLASRTMDASGFYKKLKGQYLTSLRRNQKESSLSSDQEDNPQYKRRKSVSDSSEDDSMDDFRCRKIRKRPKIVTSESVSDSESNEGLELDPMDVGNSNNFIETTVEDITESEKSKLNFSKNATATLFSLPPNQPKQNTPGSIKVINDFPLPRFAMIAQNKHAAFKKPMPSTSSKINNVLSKRDVRDHVKTATTSKNSSRWMMTKEEQKQARLERLRELELKKLQEKGEKDAPVKVKQPAKVKLTTRNRNLQLMESMMGSKINDAGSVVGGPTSAIPNSTKPLQLPELPVPPSPLPPETSKSKPPMSTEAHLQKIIENHAAKPKENRIILTDPRLERRMNNSSRPISLALPSETEITKTARTNKHQQTPTPVINTPSNNVPSILKPGAQVVFSPPARVDPITYREPSSSKSLVEYNKPPVKPYIAEDDIYSKMLRWIPLWIEEQKRSAAPPPVSGKDPINSTVKTYQNFEVYFKTYYPLLLNEIWATISSDIEKKAVEICKRLTSYSIKIDELQISKSCPLITKSKSDEDWLVIKYHAWIKNIREVETKRDFIKLSIVGREKGKPDDIRLKDIFAFSIFNTEVYSAIGKNIDCDSRLQGTNSTGFKFCEKLFCKPPSSFTIDTSMIVKLERVCVVSPKIREFKALNLLQNSRLYKHIVLPPEEIKNTWQTGNGNSGANSAEMLTICKQKLNNDQRSMIAHISNRVFSHDPELMLMHGPPGTGKTLTIVCLMLQLLADSKKKVPASDNRRILVCTPSNAAVDEIMRRLIQIQQTLPSTFNGGKKLQILRIGEGYSKDLERYTINSKIKFQDEEKSPAISINVEITSLDNEIKELQEEIEKLKEEKGDNNLIKVQSKKSHLHDLETKKLKYQAELNTLAKTRETKVSTEQNRVSVLHDADIICSTLSASSNSQMKNFARAISYKTKQKPFLCCIIDESSQTTEPETLLPLSLDIDKLILVGDPHQLGATVLSTLAEDKGYGQSLFTRLYEFYNRKKGNNPVMMLKHQYRMHHDIVKWPNLYFYEDELKTCYSAPAAGYSLRPYYFLNLTTGQEVSNAGQIENAKEVHLVKALIDIVDEILSPSRNKWTIGVITPYSKQRSQLRKEFSNKRFVSFDSVEIDTVDGFQGQEKDIIIVSCVRTDATGFLKSRNRLNVALTRAKHSLYIIGDANCLSKDDMWRCLIQDAAQRSCKYEVQSDFATNPKVFKSVIKAKLTGLIMGSSFNNGLKI